MYLRHYLLSASSKETVFSRKERDGNIALVEGDMLQQIVLWQVVKRQLDSRKGLHARVIVAFLLNWREAAKRYTRKTTKGNKKINKEKQIKINKKRRN
jgi:hypothetical protein